MIVWGAMARKRKLYKGAVFSLVHHDLKSEFTRVGLIVV